MRLTDAMLAELRSPNGPRRAVVRTLPGAGIRRALEELIAEKSANGLVLILVPSQMLGEQWAVRLDRQGVDVQVLRSSSDALQLRSAGPEADPRGVIVATFVRAQHGQARTALANYRFGLLLLDGVTGRLPESVQGEGFITATREVALVTGTDPFEWDGARTVFEVTEQDFAEATSGVILTTIGYEDSMQNVKTLDEARQFLVPFADSDLGGTRFATGASLHEMLLKVATGAISPNQPTPQERNRAWQLADQIESLDEDQGRMAALVSLLRDHSDVSRYIVSVARRADVYYLHGHLEARQINAPVLTNDASRSELTEILESGASAILVTPALLGTLSQWPQGYDAVWWSPPLTRPDYESRMSLLATASHVRVFQFRPR
jgi:superfamily II DNA or RNA helicase